MDTRTDPVPVLPQVTSLFLGLALLLALASFAMAGTPRWWATRGAVITNEVVLTNDFAAANLGQLKNMATAAAGELQDRLAGGAGTGVLNMVNGFDQSGNFSAVTLGQLKAVAQPFYERLADAGWPCLLPDGMTTNQFYPWTGAGAQDFAVANLGQLKYVFSFTVLKVDITKILSDQFSGADENRLPPIGTYPDKNRPMLMGCSDGTTAKIKVEATVTPTSAASHTWIGVRKQGTTTILKDYLINSGGQTAVEWDSSDGDVVYEIVAGYDFNGNDDLDPSEVSVVYPDGVRVFNQGEYTSSATYLSFVALGGWPLDMPTAATLLAWFLGNTGNDTTVSVTDPYLYHPVGVEWAGSTGPCSKYSFPNLDRVVSATECQQRLGSQAIADHYAEMLTYFTAHPGDTHTFGPWSCAFSSFTFPDPGVYIGIDADMYYAFAQVNGFTVTSYQLTMHDSGGLTYDILSITAAGYFYDLYDFDITAGGFSIPAAKVQAGYPTLGDSGRVFQEDRVNFNGTWTSP